MRKREVFTLTALAFSVGVIFGFLVSPVKQGIGNNSGNTVYKNNGKKNAEDEEIQSENR